MNAITATHTLTSGQAATPADFGDQLEAATARASSTQSTHAQANGANGPGDPIEIEMDDGSIWEIELSDTPTGPAYNIKITTPDGKYGGSIYYKPGQMIDIRTPGDYSPYGSYDIIHDLRSGTYSRYGNRTEHDNKGQANQYIDKLDSGQTPARTINQVKTAINQADAERMMQEHEMQPDTIPADTIPVS